MSSTYVWSSTLWGKKNCTLFIFAIFCYTALYFDNFWHTDTEGNLQQICKKNAVMEKHVIANVQNVWFWLWCGFHAAWDESEWCILLWCLAAKTVAARHMSSCWRRLLSSAPHVRKSTELLRHKTSNFTPDMTLPPNRPGLSSVDYRIWTVIQECVYQKQQVTSIFVDELQLLTEWCIIFQAYHMVH